MDNFLSSGAVLPHGLLAQNDHATIAGFNKNYKNTALRAGVIIKRHDIDDDTNISQLTPEYDVVAFEQDSNRGITTSLYHNCLSADGLGSIADFFEKTLRVQKKRKSKGQAQSMNNQDGTVVLMLCIDGAANRAVIVGGFTHPDRKSTLQGDAMHLEGEFNGVNIKVNDDGSTSLTFKGQTDNSGTPTDSTQGNTVVSIEKDGSFQIGHDAITQRLDRKGKATLTTKDDIMENTQTNYVVQTGKNINMTAQGDTNLNTTKLVASASGDASFSSQNFTIAAQSALTVQGSSIKVTAESMASIKASQIVLDGMTALGGQGGQPLLLMTAQIFAIGNLGSPILGQAISGFTTKVTAT